MLGDAATTRGAGARSRGCPTVAGNDNELAAEVRRWAFKLQLALSAAFTGR